MINNRQLKISEGSSRKATHWKSVVITWSEFLERLKTPTRGSETLAQYLAMKKPQQDELKDVGGFVGGSLLGERRKANAVTGRDLVTLDLDNIKAGGTEEVLKKVDALKCAAAVYSTRKHAEYAPRLRVVIPLDKTVSADEYEPIARKLGEIIGIDMCDSTTFEASRLMYWPSCCLDSTYVYEVYNKDFCSADGILGMYDNWSDVSTWPVTPGTEAIERRRLKNAEDPLSKKGVIGDFCRSYDIFQAIEKFIPGSYESTVMENRLTYTGGTTTGGAIVYDDGKFLYSHHSHDPCSGLLVNSFDLIRLHKFGHLDDEAPEKAKGAGLPSFVEMKKFAQSDEMVRILRSQEETEAALAKLNPSSNSIVDTGDYRDGINQVKKVLDQTDNGKYKNSIINVCTILNNLPGLKGMLAHDIFTDRNLVLGPLIWNDSKNVRVWTDADEVQLRKFLEQFFDIRGKDIINDAVSCIFEENKFNEVEVYLRSLKWDGVPRIDTLLIDYLGAEDNAYTRGAIRKWLIAAVERAIIGGTKFEQMLILTGPQGIGKSTFFNVLGDKWFTDSLVTFEGKDSAEIIKGAWIIEFGELSGMRQHDVNVIKNGLSVQIDRYRPAYGRNVGEFPRRCVFGGTTNEDEFLRDNTGERRFWPIDVGINRPTKDIFTLFREECNQVWAEAYNYWVQGETLQLVGEADELAKIAQGEHKESSPWTGMIQTFLDKKVPLDWNSFGINKRFQFYNGLMQVPETDLVERTQICVMEVWMECMNGDRKRLKRSERATIKEIILNTPGWKKEKGTKYHGKIYGIQRGFYREQM